MRNEPWIGHWSVCAPTAQLAQLGHFSTWRDWGQQGAQGSIMCGDDRAVICGEPFVQCSGGLGFPLVALGPSGQQFTSRTPHPCEMLARCWR